MASGVRQPGAMTAAELAALAADMHAKLTDAIAVVPDLAGTRAGSGSAYDAVAGLAGPVPVQRIHGDYHLGQVMRGNRTAGSHWTSRASLRCRSTHAQGARAGAAGRRRHAALVRLRGPAPARRPSGCGEPWPAIADAWVRQCQASFPALATRHGGGTDPERP